MLEPLLRRRDLPPWSAWSVLLAIGLVIGLTLAGALLIAGAVAVAMGTETLKAPGVLLADTFVQDVALIAGVMLAVKISSGVARMVDFGVRMVDRKLRAVGLAFLLWFAFIAFAAIWEAVTGPHGKQTLVEDLGADRSAWLWLGTALLVVVFAPICEEFAFRGFLFPVFSRRGGFLFGAFITGILFGALHVGSTPLELAVPLAVLGMLLCYLRVLTGSILPGIAVHCVNNSIAFAVAEKLAIGTSIALMACGLIVTTTIGATAARGH